LTVGACVAAQRAVRQAPCRSSWRILPMPCRTAGPLCADPATAIARQACVGRQQCPAAPMHAGPFALMLLYARLWPARGLARRHSQACARRACPSLPSLPFLSLNETWFLPAPPTHHGCQVWGSDWSGCAHVHIREQKHDASARKAPNPHAGGRGVGQTSSRPALIILAECMEEVQARHVVVNRFAGRLHDVVAEAMRRPGRSHALKSFL
jgi:hypothetical protein